jgi:hypothetical protein
MDLRICSAV